MSSVPALHTLFHGALLASVSIYLCQPGSDEDAAAAGKWWYCSPLDFPLATTFDVPMMLDSCSCLMLESSWRLRADLLNNVELNGRSELGAACFGESAKMSSETLSGVPANTVQFRVTSRFTCQFTQDTLSHPHGMCGMQWTRSTSNPHVRNRPFWLSFKTLS